MNKNNKKAYFKEEWLGKDNFPEFLPWLVKGKMSTQAKNVFTVFDVFPSAEADLAVYSVSTVEKPNQVGCFPIASVAFASYDSGKH